MQVAAPPDVLRWSPRSQGHGDCAIGAIQLACGVSYETALAAAITFEPEVLVEGLLIKEIEKTIRLLGFDVRRRRQYDLNEDTGILSLDSRSAGHVVYLWEGRILEPDSHLSSLWLDPRAYLTHYRYKAGVLIEVTRKEEA